MCHNNMIQFIALCDERGTLSSCNVRKSKEMFYIPIEQQVFDVYNVTLFNVVEFSHRVLMHFPHVPLW